MAVIDTGSNILAMPSEAVRPPGPAGMLRRDGPQPPVAPCRTLTKTLDVSSDCSNMDQLPNLHFAPVPRMPDL